MKRLVKKVLPPAAINLLKKIPIVRSFENTHSVFPTYQDALKRCTTDAYEEKELIEVILKKTKRFSENLNSEILSIGETTAYGVLPIINPIIENKEKKVHVLDFGGACGAHYFHVRSFINKALKLNWVVVETPTMVKYAKELENDELSFCDNLEEATSKLGNIDLLHTSGTLQCVDDPYKYLRSLLNCKAKYILFNRLGLNKQDKDIITIHSSKLSWNGIGALPEGYRDRWIRYPFTFQSEPKFLKAVEEKYSFVAKFNDLSGMYPINGEDIVGYGLLCKSKINEIDSPSY